MDDSVLPDEGINFLQISCLWVIFKFLSVEDEIAAHPICYEFVAYLYINKRSITEKPWLFRKTRIPLANGSSNTMILLNRWYAQTINISVE